MNNSITRSTFADGFQEDGVSAISFGDPLGQMDPQVDCTGLLVSAGFTQEVTETRNVNGHSFATDRLGIYEPGAADPEYPTFKKIKIRRY